MNDEIKDTDIDLYSNEITHINDKKDALEEIQEKAQPFFTLMTYYRCAMMEIETKFKVLDEEYSLAFDRNPISSIQTRLKKTLSIKEKLARKNLPISCENIEKNIFDVAGIRVICTTPADVYMLSEALLKQDDIFLIEMKDYIKHPKPNGYRSLHMIVGIPIFLANEKRMMKAEIQLRTMAMDFWASLEHQIRYKKNNNISPEISKELFECAELSASLDRRMEFLRKEIEANNDPTQKLKAIHEDDI